MIFLTSAKTKITSSYKEYRDKAIGNQKIDRIFNHL